MTNKLVVIINSLKVPKFNKILLYEMKFLVPNYSCLQNPWLRGNCPHIPVLSVLCPQLNLLNLPQTKFLGMPLLFSIIPGGLNQVCPKIWGVREIVPNKSPVMKNMKTEEPGAIAPLQLLHHCSCYMFTLLLTMCWYTCLVLGVHG